MVSDIYVETSVINGFYSKQTRIATAGNLFFEKVKQGNIVAHVSDYVLVEINRTKDRVKRDKLLQLLSLCRPDAPSGKRVLEVASIYVQKGMIPARYIFDAYHIAS